MKTLMNVGTNKESVKEAKDAILAILKSGQDQITIQGALIALVNACKTDANISYCTFTANEPEKKKKKKSG